MKKQTFFGHLGIVLFSAAVFFTAGCDNGSQDYERKKAAREAEAVREAERVKMVKVRALIKKECDSYLTVAFDFIPEKVMQNPEGTGWTYSIRGHHPWFSAEDAQRLDIRSSGARIEVFVREKDDGSFEASSEIIHAD